MADEAMVEVPNNEEKVAEPKGISEAEARDIGLSEDEVKLGIEQGDIVKSKDGSEGADADKEAENSKTDKSDKPTDTPDDEGKEDKSEDGVGKNTPAEETDDDDDPEKEHEAVKDFSPNEKALYFKQKKEKKKRQAAERAKDLAKVQLEAVRRENELLKSTQPKTEDQATSEVNEDDDEKIVTVGDLKKQDQQKQEQRAKAEAQAKEINARLNLQEAEAKSKYDDFDVVCDLAKEVMAADKYGVYAHKMALIAADPEGDVAEYVYQLGKANPKFKELSKDDKQSAKGGGKDKQVEKIVANANKRTSSASVGGGSGTRVMSEADLSVEDIANMPQAQWDKLSDKTRERLLRESCR